MNDDHGSDPSPGPEVGSLHEETVRLLGALGEWAQHSDQHGGRTNDQTQPGAAVPSGSDDCRFCPVCQVIHVVRSTSPEVRAHLATAATALLQAASELMATHVPRPGAPGSDGANEAGVEKIDLDDDDPAHPS